MQLPPPTFLPHPRVKVWSPAMQLLGGPASALRGPDVGQAEPGLLPLVPTTPLQVWGTDTEGSLAHLMASALRPSLPPTEPPGPQQSPTGCPPRGNHRAPALRVSTGLGTAGGQSTPLTLTTGPSVLLGSLKRWGTHSLRVSLPCGSQHPLLQEAQLPVGPAQPRPPTPPSHPASGSCSAASRPPPAP